MSYIYTLSDVYFDLTIKLKETKRQPLENGEEIKILKKKVEFPLQGGRLPYTSSMFADLW